MRACPTPQYKPHHPRHRLAVTGSSLADKLSTYKAYAALGLDDRRTLISTMLSVVVNPGRGPEESQSPLGTSGRMPQAAHG